MTWHVLFFIAWILWSRMHPEMPNIVPRELIAAAVAVEQLATKANHTMDVVHYVLWAIIALIVVVGLVQLKKLFAGESK